MANSVQTWVRQAGTDGGSRQTEQNSNEILCSATVFKTYGAMTASSKVPAVKCSPSLQTGNPSRSTQPRRASAPVSSPKKVAPAVIRKESATSGSAIETTAHSTDAAP